MTFASLRYLTLGSLLALGACGDDDSAAQDADHDAEHDADHDTANECPADLSFDKSATPVLTKYCEVCHSAKNAKALGAGNVIVTEADIRDHGSHLYELVDSGEMPKSGGPLTEAEKKDFLDWMTCSGAAATGHDHDHD